VKRLLDAKTRPLAFEVIDAFLSDEDFQACRLRLQHEDFCLRNTGEWLKGDGFSPVQNLETSPTRIDHSRLLGGFFGETYVPLLNQLAVLIRDEQAATIIGVPGIDWQYISFITTMFPAGGGLPWHPDSNGKTGAFIYYLHDKWQANWGGDLLLYDHKEPLSEWRKQSLFGETQPMVPAFDDAEQSEYLMERGMGYYVRPKPNRLVIFMQGIHHMVGSVDSSAGGICRTAIAGFFVK